MLADRSRLARSNPDPCLISPYVSLTVELSKMENSPTLAGSFRRFAGTPSSRSHPLCFSSSCLLDEREGVFEIRSATFERTPYRLPPGGALVAEALGVDWGGIRMGREQQID